MKYYYTGIAIPIEDLDIFLEFKRLCIKKYGKVKGGLSKYLMALIKEEVYRESMSKQQHAGNSMQNHVTKGLSTRTINTILAIKKYLIEQGIFYEISEKELLRIIQYVTHAKDMRTIKKYYKLLLDMNCKPMARGYSVIINVEEFVNHKL